MLAFLFAVPLVMGVTKSYAWETNGLMLGASHVLPFSEQYRAEASSRTALVLEWTTLWADESPYIQGAAGIGFSGFRGDVFTVYADGRWYPQALEKSLATGFHLYGYLGWGLRYLAVQSDRSEPVFDWRGTPTGQTRQVLRSHSAWGLDVPVGLVLGNLERLYVTLGLTYFLPFSTSSEDKSATDGLHALLIGGGVQYAWD